MIGVIISEKEYREYMNLKEKDKQMEKIYYYGTKHCPECGYVVDYRVPPQNYCDNCGQRLVR